MDSFEELKVKRVFLFWVVMIFAFIGLIAVIYYVGSAVISLTENTSDPVNQQVQISEGQPADLPPLDFPIPMLAGSSSDNARELLISKGWNVEERFNFLDGTAEGEVIATEPIGGSFLSIGETVVLIVSLGPEGSQIAPPQPTRPPNDVKVFVANGSGVGGAAGAVTNLLKPYGYTTLSPGNGNKDEKSWVYYKPGFYYDALGIANILGVTSSLLTSFPNVGISAPEGSLNRIDTADVVVFLGFDKEIYGSSYGDHGYSPPGLDSQKGYEPSLNEGLGSMAWIMFNTCVDAARDFTLELFERIKMTSGSTPEKFEKIFRELDTWVKDTPEVKVGSQENIQSYAKSCEVLTPDLYNGFYTNVKKWISQCIQSRSFATSISDSNLCHDPNMAFELGSQDNFFIAMGMRLRTAEEWIVKEETLGTFGGSFD